MKLSEAMMLGSATCKMVPMDWNSCALGAAANALGIEKSVNSAGYLAHSTKYTFRSELIMRQWPWLRTDNHSLMSEIYLRFDSLVCDGKMTFEQLVDYVRSVEPSCGECNRFNCHCVTTPQPIEEHEYAR